MQAEEQGAENKTQAKRHKRFEVLENREVNKDGFVKEWPEVGLIATGGPEDPEPSLKIEEGVIVEMDGKPRDDFDLLDHFIARYALNNDIAEEMMAIDAVEIARMLVDINVPRNEVLKVFQLLHRPRWRP